jgi:hypothetical protein
MEHMEYKSLDKRLQAAYAILHAQTIDKASFDSLKTLLSGISPKVDRLLTGADKAFRNVDHMQKGDAIYLTLEAWPETSPEQKKRKKAFLLFFKWWNDLKNEVARIEKELDKSQKAGNGQGAGWGHIFATAKGPLGILTLIAAGVVLLKASEVTIRVQNQGCAALVPPTRMAIHSPGLKLPSESIISGEEAVVKIPPLSFTVDATQGSSAHVTIAGMSYSFPMGRSAVVTFDGKTINNAKTDIALGSQKEHVLRISCN